ncbi:hypothetical protein [Marinobacter alexandrii]|uniref:hypothetical protein n=1 Tax=Marinobacter alexandrii TaxID=2570351 RepID=UPI00329A47D7
MKKGLVSPHDLPLSLWDPDTQSIVLPELLVNLWIELLKANNLYDFEEPVCERSLRGKATNATNLQTIRLLPYLDSCILTSKVPDMKSYIPVTSWPKTARATISCTRA